MFFFKQKTAYEMRISDWSSDVCSSDLLSDAGHMLTDVLGLGMALAAIQLASRGTERGHQTFGLYRLEILAALANAVLLFGVAVYVVMEAIGRRSEERALGNECVRPCRSRWFSTH